MVSAIPFPPIIVKILDRDERHGVGRKQLMTSRNMAISWQDKQISFLPFPAIFYNPAANMASREILSKSSNWRYIMFIAGKSIEPMGDSLQNVFHGDRKVLGVDAGETFEEVGQMVIKPSAARRVKLLGDIDFSISAGRPKMG